MKITPVMRRNILVGLAFVLVIFVLIDGQDDERSPVAADAAASVKSPRAKAADAPIPEIPLDKLDAKVSRDPVVDAFESRSWAPPPPPPLKVVPEPPRAPPLPFTYMGKMMEDDQIIVYLSRQDRNYAVKQGQTIDGTYRVDDISGGTMLVTYLPLNQQQILAIGAAN